MCSKPQVLKFSQIHKWQLSEDSSCAFGVCVITNQRNDEHEFWTIHSSAIIL